MPSQAELTRKRFLILSDFQEASRLKKYHGSWYSEDSWRDIIHQKIEIKIALAFTGKDPRNAIRKDKNFNHVIKERSYTKQWGIDSLDYYHERKRVHIFQAAPIGDIPLETP